MSKTSSCIKMLMLLNARGVMNSSELAEALEINKRNIREYRAEIEKAGFYIQEIKGRYGGYSLMQQHILPSPVLTDDEKQALIDGRQYLTSRKDVVDINHYNDAIDKVLNTSYDKNRHDTFFVANGSSRISKKEEDMLHICKQAMEEGKCVELTYRKVNADEAETYLVEPYEILHYDSAYYMLAFSLKRNDYRNYRFSEERMLDCKISSRKFLRDSNFHIENYIGKTHLVKANYQKVVVEVALKAVPLFKEMEWGADFKEESVNLNSITYSFFVENQYSLFSKLFAMGKDIKLLEPKSIVDSYRDMIFSISQNYKE
ncbi:MAG: WYL domain-containing protein [Firmicutes bacterium]|nr:WYL domain-containing protein [Bacillota bacterium]